MFYSVGLRPPEMPVQDSVPLVRSNSPNSLEPAQQEGGGEGGMGGGRGRRELATQQGKTAVVLHVHALQPLTASAFTTASVPVLDPKLKLRPGAHRRGARWCMGGLHQGG
jgi:hypothetical protein